MTSNLPGLSIVVERIKGEDSLSVFSESLQKQSFRDYEVFESAIGVASLNEAASKIRSQYLTFMAVGQEWASAKLAKQMALLSQSGLNWCYCDAVPWGEQLHTGDVLRPLLMRNFIPPGSVVIRSELFAALGGLSEKEELAGHEEWDLWLRVAKRNPIGLVNEPLLKLRVATAEGVRSEGARAVVESAVMRNEVELKDVRSEALAEICVSAGIKHLKANRRDAARAEFAEALTHSPLRADAYLNWASSFLSSDAQQQIRDLHNLSRLTQAWRCEEGDGRTMRSIK